jgi:hypothetical protein
MVWGCLEVFEHFHFDICDFFRVSDFDIRILKKEEIMKANVTIPIPVWLDFIFALPLLGLRLLRYGYSYRRINLGEGRYALVDQVDFYWLNKFRWHAEGENEYIYAVRNDIKPGRKMKTVRMHREITNAPRHLLVDHGNNKTLDNRRANLRLATSSQNAVNRRRRCDKSKASSKYTGVSLEKGRNKWLAYISFNGKRKHLGRFDNEIDAARAYDKAALEFHKEFARLNFPQDKAGSCPP